MQVVRHHTGGEIDVVRLDVLKDVLAIAHQVHLVHRDQHVFDAQQGGDEAMPFCLFDNAVSSIDQDDGQIAGRRASRHITRVLLMPWRVRNDELAPRRREVPIGDVDCDALFTLRFQSVRQQSRIEVAPGGAVDGRIAPNRR